MPKKQKLELTWIGKDQRPKLEPRILIEDPDKSYHAPQRVSENDIFDNMLIHGDNLLALKALEQEYTGKVKCVFIDPPYNTGSAFSHYDDGVEHSLWLSLIRDRIAIIHSLLADNGSLWVTLDDNEAHYFKVMCDEIFGRNNFITDTSWEKADSPRMDAKYFSSRHDHLLVYAKNLDNLHLGRIADTEIPKHYNKVDDEGRPYYLKPLRAMGADGHRAKRPSMYFPIIAPDGTEIFPQNPDGTDSRWRWGKERVEKDSALLEWVKTKKGWSLYFRIYFENSSGRPPETIWFNSEVGSNRTSKKEIKNIFGSEVFDTPKPEALIQRIIDLSTKPGDLVLDSFLGSATTAAVAHKMGRRWIGVELGDHCSTHCQPRLKKVVDAKDPGGVTEAANWKGGGGFRYYELGPSLIEKDKWGNPIISKEFDPPKLTQAMCKLEGFDYAPDPNTYWMQGRSSETDFIYVTSQSMSKAALTKLSDEVGDNRSLLICCPSFRAKESDFTNLSLKKIPKAVLKKCEWGRDDYSLQIQELPPAPPPEENEAEDKPKKPRRKFGKGNPNQGELF